MFDFTPYHPWIAILVTLFVFVGLQFRRGASVDLLFLGGLIAVTLAGVIDVQTALEGFSNNALLTIAGLLAVAAGLRLTGVLDWVGNKLLGSAKTEGSALRRLAVSLVATSAVLLNTALVAMMMPVVIDWCRKRNISASRLLIPLSYLTILGGVCTLIGTSPTLVINGMLGERIHPWHQTKQLQDRDDRSPEEASQVKHISEAELSRREKFAKQTGHLEFFEIGWVGLPCALVGIAYFFLIGRRLLPNRTDIIEQLDDHRREYLVEMLVREDCHLIGQSVEQAGLRNLPGLFLIEIDRDGDVITPVTPKDEIHAGDRLIFTGIVSTIVDLEKIPGLVPAADLSYEVHPQLRRHRHLTEVVLSRTTPLIGTTVREANFRQRYNAAVVAVHRNGIRLTNKIGNIKLEPGDTLLLQTRNEFVTQYRNNRDFYLVSSVEGSQPRRHDKALVAGGLLILLVVWLSLTNVVGTTDARQGFSSTAVAAIAVAGLMVVTRCLSMSEARRSIDLQLLITIAAALGLGRAITESGADEAIASALIQTVQSFGVSEAVKPYALLIVIYLSTLLFTEIITNIAVATMLLPLAVAVAWEAGYNPRPFIMAITLAASLSFITPIGYQTNLMVMGPGGYRPHDYLRIGLPLAFLIAVTALVLIPIVWPLKLS